MPTINTATRPLHHNIPSAGRRVLARSICRPAATVFAETADLAEAMAARRPALHAVAADLRAKALRAEARA